MWKEKEESVPLRQSGDGSSNGSYSCSNSSVGVLWQASGDSDEKMILAMVRRSEERETDRRILERLSLYVLN